MNFRVLCCLLFGLVFVAGCANSKVTPAAIDPNDTADVQPVGVPTAVGNPKSGPGAARVRGRTTAVD